MESISYGTHSMWPDEGHSDLSQDRQPARRATLARPYGVSDISGFEVDDALIIAEQIELQSPTTCITPVVASTPRTVVQ
jgi:hypothetical protein